MGASKETFMEVRLQAEMSEDVYRDIPEALRDTMTIKRIDMPNYSELYKKDEIWQELNDRFVKALVDKKDREMEIRINNKLNK